MPPKAKTPEQLTCDKNTMIDAALSLIKKDGLEKFSIRKLSVKMGMSAANMYNYFYNKDEIYIYIRMRGFNLLHQEYDRLVSRLTNPQERLESYIRQFISFGINYPGYYQVMFSTGDPKSFDYIGSPLEELAKEEKQNAMKSFFYLRDIIIECSSTLSPSEAYITATRIICEMHGVISLYQSNIITELSLGLDDVQESLIKHIIMEFLPKYA